MSEQRTSEQPTDPLDPLDPLDRGATGRARRAASWVGIALAGLVTIGSIGTLTLALGTHADATASLERARRLEDAQEAVARAEAQLGESDLQTAVATAERANATALEVKSLIERMVRLLAPTRETAGSIVASARSGTSNVVYAHRQTELAAQLLGAIAGYQGSATESARKSNRALERILAALRETNRSFEGR